MTGRANWNWVAAACLVIGLVYLNHRNGPALAAPSNPGVEAGDTVEPAETAPIQPPSNENVERVEGRLEEDPFLQHRTWFQDLNTGRTPVTKENLDTFLNTSRYPIRRVEGVWRALEVPDGSTTTMVYVALSASSRALWLRLDLRTLDTAVTSNAIRLSALLRDSGKGGEAFFRITGDNILSLCDHVETDGLTTAELEQAVAWIIDQAGRTADVWRD